MKITNLKYQRNGVHGDGFYHCKVSGLFDKRDEFIVTFEFLDEDEEVINRSSCRVVNLVDLSLPYRGDEIAGKIEKKLKGKI